MHYTKNKLESFQELNTFELKEEYNIIVENLVDKVINNKTISLAEENFVCGIMSIMRDQDNNPLNIKNYTSCNNYYFRNKYLTYHNDLNGHYKIVDYDGEINIITKQQDVNYLNITFKNWLIFMKENKNNDNFIKYIYYENDFHLKALNKYCKKYNFGSNYRKYLEKSITLHSKYIYLLVKEFFQELGSEEIIIEINEYHILINPFSYIHIMFRHFAGHIKEYQNKTYHFDEYIGFKNIPNILLEILRLYQSNPINSNFNGLSLYLRINKKPYSIYFRKVYNSSINMNQYRLQTFFPIGDVKELQKLSNLQIVRINDNIEIYS